MFQNPFIIAFFACNSWKKNEWFLDIGILSCILYTTLLSFIFQVQFEVNSLTKYHSKVFFKYTCIDSRFCFKNKLELNKPLSNNNYYGNSSHKIKRQV